MKKLILKFTFLLLFLSIAQSVFAQCSNTNISNGWTCVVSASAQSSDTSNVTSSSVDTSTANLLVLGVAKYTAVGEPTVSDSKSNTWNALTEYRDQNNENFRWQWYYCSSCTVGSGHTFTASGTSTYPCIGVFALKTASASPFDIEAGAGTSGTQPTLQVSLGTPNQDNSVLVTGVHLGTATSVATIDLSYSIKEQIAQVSGAGEGCAIAIKTQSTAASSAPTWTFTVTDNLGSSGIAAFKQGTGTPAASNGLLTLGVK